MVGIKIDYEEILLMRNEKLQKFINDLQKLIRENDFSCASVSVEKLPKDLMANYDSKIMEKYIEYDPELNEYVPCFWYNKKFFDAFNIVYNV